MPVPVPVPRSLGVLASRRELSSRSTPLRSDPIRSEISSLSLEAGGSAAEAGSGSGNCSGRRTRLTERLYPKAGGRRAALSTSLLGTRLVSRSSAQLVDGRRPRQLGSLEKSSAAPDAALLRRAKRRRSGRQSAITIGDLRDHQRQSARSPSAITLCTLRRPACSRRARPACNHVQSSAIKRNHVQSSAIKCNQVAITCARIVERRSSSRSWSCLRDAFSRSA